LTPRLWILAGPNGSGKSTFANTDVFQRLSQTPEDAGDLVRLNPDQMAKQLALERPDLSGDQISVAAAEKSDAALDHALDQRRSILVETVLSSDKLLARVDEAKIKLYWIGLIYVVLQSPDLNVARVAGRVRQGGHGVPEDRIRSRWYRSLERLPVFASKASAYSIWDNGGWGEAPVLLIEQNGGLVYVSSTAEDLMEAGQADPALIEALHKVLATA
jgi:predicted ABC-type ATPase